MILHVDERYSDGDSDDGGIGGEGGNKTSTNRNV